MGLFLFFGENLHDRWTLEDMEDRITVSKEKEPSYPEVIRWSVGAKASWTVVVKANPHVHYPARNKPRHFVMPVLALRRTIAC